MKYFFAFSCLFWISLPAFAQLDSIYNQGVYRSFIVHKPANYTPSQNYPLVLDLHGYNANAAVEQAYTQFDAIADTADFVVVYPNAILGSWDLTSSYDVNFLNSLIDSLRQNYSLNSCLFFTGISRGAFMTYKFACESPRPLTAVGVVAGNMTTFQQSTCTFSSPLPIMHFHGTADAIVGYNGSLGIPPVETTVANLAAMNNCSPIPVQSNLPDLDPNDACTVQKYAYLNGNAGSEVLLYKILNGGHTWPGAIPIVTLGNTTQDIKASSLIWQFFSRYCSISVGNELEAKESGLLLYPNPARSAIELTLPSSAFFSTADLFLYDLQGHEVHKQNIFLPLDAKLSFPNLPAGNYYLRLNTDKKRSFTTILSWVK